jgi:hypothetical protein
VAEETQDADSPKRPRRLGRRKPAEGSDPAAATPDPAAQASPPDASETVQAAAEHEAPAAGAEAPVDSPDVGGEPEAAVSAAATEKEEAASA